MNSNPKFIWKSQESSGFLHDHNYLDQSLNFLPVLNDDCSVDHVLLWHDPTEVETHALIMAGGFGRRLGAETLKRPKPLVEVGGIPLIEHVLRRLESVNVQHIYMSVHYRAEMLVDYIKETGRELTVTILHEKEPLGTAGAISLLPQIDSGNVLVTNCDLISELNFNDLVQFHMASKTDATIAAVTHKFQIPFGVLKYDDKGHFRMVEEKPIVSNYIAAGIYVFSSNFIEKNKSSNRLDMPDLINRGRDVGMKMSVFPIHEEWTDVGRPEELQRANDYLSEKGKVG